MAVAGDLELAGRVLDAAWERAHLAEGGEVRGAVLGHVAGVGAEGGGLEAVVFADGALLVVEGEGACAVGLEEGDEGVGLEEDELAGRDEVAVDELVQHGELEHGVLGEALCPPCLYSLPLAVQYDFTNTYWLS